MSEAAKAKFQIEHSISLRYTIRPVHSVALSVYGMRNEAAAERADNAKDHDGSNDD
jgi:hypothetical protein